MPIKTYMKKVLFPFIFLALLSGCTINEEGAEIATIEDDTECEDSGGAFCNEDSSVTNLELVIETANPLIAASANGDCNGNDTRLANGDKPALETLLYCFDFSGSCNEASLDSAFVVGRLSLDSFNTAYTLGSCKRGRFHVQLRLGLTLGQLCTLHTLELELIGKRADETEVTEPAKARKRTGFQVFNHESCQP